MSKKDLILYKLKIVVIVIQSIIVNFLSLYLFLAYSVLIELFLNYYWSHIPRSTLKNVAYSVNSFEDFTYRVIPIISVSLMILLFLYNVITINIKLLWKFNEKEKQYLAEKAGLRKMKKFQRANSHSNKVIRWLIKIGR